ncbi:hypothetical protein N9A45_01025 [bacterium]|nr:hypothetical protein [bacterium]
MNTMQQYCNDMSGVLSNDVSALALVPNGAKIDSDDDGWDSSDDDGSEHYAGEQTFKFTPPPAQLERPTWSMEDRERIPELLSVENFVVDESGNSLYRCEPAKKQNPTLGGLKCLAHHSKVVVFICLFNSFESVPMRTPDSKTKSLNNTRLQGGIVINPSEVDAVRFKKKCQDKAGKDLAFELGKGFMSHTAGATPQFIFVAVPYENGYLKEKAVRSPTFRVFSKRQERFLEPKQKKRRKNAEIHKLDTDIGNAVTTFRALEQELRHADFIHGAMKAFFGQMRAQVAHMQDDTARIALEFALRSAEEPETASM